MAPAMAAPTPVMQLPSAAPVPGSATPLPTNPNLPSADNFRSQ
jgi:hypothetical protein